MLPSFYNSLGFGLFELKKQQTQCQSGMQNLREFVLHYSTLHANLEGRMEKKEETVEAFYRHNGDYKL